MIVPVWVQVPPAQLQLDPFGRTYDDLVQTLTNAGYVPGQTLFLAPWDWRLPLIRAGPPMFLPLLPISFPRRRSPVWSGSAA